MQDLISFHPRATPPKPGPDPDPIVVGVASRPELLAEIEARLRAGQGFTVATLNLDHIVKLGRDPAFRRAYAGHSHVVADGNPVVWLHRLAGRHLQLVPGSELVLPLAELAGRLDVPVALLGSTEEVLALASDRLEATCPGLRVVARIAPPHGLDPEGPLADACLDQLAASGARLCFLALGAPKQELLAIRGQARLPGCGFVSIGAGLDFIAGQQKRAPLWVRRLALEWLWRMAGSPRRLARRYAQCVLVLPGLSLDALRERRTNPPD